MMMRLVIKLGFLSHLLCIFGQPMVRVEQGQIQGKTVIFQSDYLDMTKNVDVFTGIPYAEPPLGDGRFSPPRPKQAWADDEVYNATYPRDVCFQDVRGNIDVTFYNQSEDCLHLNVYAPNPKPSNAAVMVFIHGGGYAGGNAYDRLYGGLPLSGIGEVILVTMNYRLSALGFITTGDDSLPGDYGMLDQVEALRWVKNNIQAFGGNANKITIFGESAGAGSVSAHIYSPLSRDLFDQAILESGSVLAGWSFVDINLQREAAFRVAAAVGCSAVSSQELLSCLRNVDAHVLLSAAVETGFVGSPCVDRNFLVEPPMTSIMTNNFKKCPMINGFNKDEGTLYILFAETGYFNLELNNTSKTTAPFISMDKFDREFLTLLGLFNVYTNDIIFDSIKQEYVDWSKADDPEADYFDEFNSASLDVFFACPAVLETRYHAMAGGDSNIYQYFFTHVPSIGFIGLTLGGAEWLGAGHGEELPFVFGYPFVPSPYLESYEYPEEEKELSYQFIKYWTNFAKTGNPAKESDVSMPYSDDRAWPAFTIPELQYKELAVNLAEGRGLRADECNFWNNYMNKLKTFTADLIETEKQWREDFTSWKYRDMKNWRDAFTKYQEITNN